MMNNRAAQRHLTLRTGKILAADGPGTVDCAVLNMSRTGACILVPAGATVPNGFALVIDCEDTIRNCQVVWRDGPRIGLSFDCRGASG